MADSKVEIERLANGYEVSFCDPDIVAANAKSMKSSAVGGSYKNPHVEMLFKTSEEVIGFLGKHLEKIAAAESYDSAFMKALKE